MSTRKPRNSGKKQRSWEDLNGSIGQDGCMESEAWFIALRRCLNDDNDGAETTLVDHFGTKQAAWQAYRSLAPQVAERFQDVAHALFAGY